MIRRNRNTLAVRALGLALVLLGIAAAPALAAPSLSLGLTHNANEIQKVYVKATGGKFTLSLGSGGSGVSQTSEIPVPATAGQVEAALNALTDVSAGGGSVKVEGGPSNSLPFEIHFNGGPLANTNVPEIAAASAAAAPLSGGPASIGAWTIRQGGVVGHGERLDYTINVTNAGASPTSGPVTVELELPAGQETFANSFTRPYPPNEESTYQGGAENWTCSASAAAGATPAKAICTSSEVVSPGNSFKGIRVVSQVGADAPKQAVAAATASGGGAPSPASAIDAFETSQAPFGVQSFNAAILDPSGQPYTQAGGHPLTAATSFSFALKRKLTPFGGSNERFVPIEEDRLVIVNAPRGFVGNALAVPALCPDASNPNSCPAGSLVGGIDLETSEFGIVPNLPIYAIQPEYGLPAEFVFKTQVGQQFTFFPKLRADEGYAIAFESAPNPKVQLMGANVTLCDFGGIKSGSLFSGCKSAAEATAADPAAKPLISNPTRCAGSPPTAVARANSWATPDVFAEREFINPTPTGCDQVPFEPEAQLVPTNRRADSPTGLDVEVTVPTAGLESPTGISQANLDNVTITFPQGMSINPSASDGLGACSEAQVKLESNADAECPDSSQVGDVEIKTPLIRETLTGHVYLAKQNENPFKSTFGIYLVFSSKKDGITIKIPGKLVPDPVTGKLTAALVESPEDPFSKAVLHFNNGPRAPLTNPASCGNSAIHSELSPWSAVDPAHPTAAEIRPSDSEFVVNEGPGGGPCPSGALDPKLKAGTKDPAAGAKSAFVMSLRREDGTDRLAGLSVTAPPGLAAYLKGVPYCPAAAIEAARAREKEEMGALEQADPSCPAASLIGTAQAGAGSGPDPFYAGGKVYLAGPYKGAPLSLVLITPAVAGPFDLGNVVVRNALYVNRTTGQVTVKSDPIPTILHGILLDIRDIRVNIDRPGFTVNPTNCEPLSVNAQVNGLAGASASVSSRFQVGGCQNLAFKPKLTAKVTGPTKRGDLPAFTAELTYPEGPGYANIKDVQVTLPHSEFLEQAHINTVCTRVQAAANACPAGSIYGYAEATTPLLDGVLKGPVFLKSSVHKLPDLAIALKGPDNQPIEVEFAGRIDAVHGQIRNTIEGLPDVPVSKFVLKMKGGKKGLLVNSRNLCQGRPGRMTVDMTAQNNKTADSRPLLGNSCGSHRKLRKHHRRPRGRHLPSRLAAIW